MTRLITKLIGGCAVLFAATSCTYIIESDTIELSDKVDMLAARLEKVETANTAAEIAALKQSVAELTSYLQNAAARQREARQRPQQRPGPVAQAQPQPRPQPQPRKQREGKQPRQGGQRQQVTPAERAVRRAAYIAGRADLSEEQAGALASVLQNQQERFVSLSQAVREGRVAKEDVDKQRELVRAQTQKEFDTFLATVTEAQKELVLKALQPRKRGGPGKQKGAKPPRQPKPQRKAKGGNQ